MKQKNKPGQNLRGELPPKPLPLPGQLEATPTVEAEQKADARRIPARMKPGELPLAEEAFVMPWHLMWPD